MITFAQAQALKSGAEIHREDRKPCHVEVGPRGGRKTFVDVWRVSGKMQTWKTRPGEFSIPIKWGFYGPHAYLTHVSASYFHIAADCPTHNKENSHAPLTHA